MRLPKFLAALLAVGWLATAIPAFAADPVPTGCNCWCTSKAGATSAGDVRSSAVCATTCQDKGEKVIVCSKKASELPANNVRCFENEEVCKLNCQGPSLPNAKPAGFIYDKENQPTECPSKYHYCYCTGESYQLAYKIPNPDPSKPPIGEVADLGSYVNTVYKYLLGISGLVAIVMIMIGGVQYVTSVGGGSVSAAKERIQHAVVGLILLFSAALILQTVNPRLLTLQPPRLPTIKRIELVDPNASCEALLKPDRAGKVYTLAGKATNGTNCGSKDEVLKDRSGAEVAEGTVCTYRGCSDKTKGCFVSGDKAQCLSCGEVVPGNELNIIPSTNVCAQIDESLKAQEPLVTNHPYCFWSRDPYALFGLNWQTAKAGLAVAIGAGAGSFVGPAGAAVGAGIGASVGGALELRQGTCSEMKIECRRIESLSCEGYNDLEITNAKASDSDLKNISPGWGDQDMQSICQANPCQWNKDKGGCSYVPESNTCRTAGSGTTLTNCSSDSQCDNGNKCINGHCSAPSATGANRQVCGAGNTCNAGLACVRSIGSGQGAGGFTDVCTDGQPNSPCNSNSDCKNAGASCVNYACASSVARPNGTACSENFECQSNFCGSGLCRLGTAGENCGVTGPSQDQCAPGFYCGGATGPYSCVAKVTTGGTCTQNVQCANGTCVGNNTDLIGSQGQCN